MIKTKRARTHTHTTKPLVTRVQLHTHPWFDSGQDGGRVGTLFQICTDIGVKISDYSALGHEKEVLLPPGMTFVVKSRLLNMGGFNIITIEHDKSVPLLVM